jgi:hypothetical protein
LRQCVLAGRKSGWAVADQRGLTSPVPWKLAQGGYSAPAAPNKCVQLVLKACRTLESWICMGVTNYCLAPAPGLGSHPAWRSTAAGSVAVGGGGAPGAPWQLAGSNVLLAHGAQLIVLVLHGVAPASVLWCVFVCSRCCCCGLHMCCGFGVGEVAAQLDTATALAHSRATKQLRSCVNAWPRRRFGIALCAGLNLPCLYYPSLPCAVLACPCAVYLAQGTFWQQPGCGVVWEEPCPACLLPAVTRAATFSLCTVVWGPVLGVACHGNRRPHLEREGGVTGPTLANK